MIIGLLLSIQVLVAFALIAIVLIQQTDNSGLGLAGASGGDASSLLQTRASASFLTRATSGLAAAFMLVSLAQGILAGGYGSSGGFISNTLGLTTPAAEIDNSAAFNPIVFDDGAAAGEENSGTDTSNLLFDPTISVDESAPAAAETPADTGSESGAAADNGAATDTATTDSQ